MQTEGDLDNVWNAFGGRSFALLIFESFRVAACLQESLLQMFDADDAEMLGRNWLAVLPHRREQLGDAGAVHPLDAEELGDQSALQQIVFELFNLTAMAVIASADF